MGTGDLEDNNIPNLEMKPKETREVPENLPQKQKALGQDYGGVPYMSFMSPINGM